MRLVCKAHPSTSVGFKSGIFKSRVEEQWIVRILTLVVNSKKYSQCLQKLLLERWYFERELSKILWKFNFIFYGYCYEKWKEIGPSYQPLFRLPNMFRSFFYFVIDQLTIFYALIQRGFGVFPKITVINLCKPFNDVIIISFSTFSWNHNTLDKKKKNFKKLSKRSF